MRRAAENVTVRNFSNRRLIHVSILIYESILQDIQLNMQIYVDSTKRNVNIENILNGKKNGGAIKNSGQRTFRATVLVTTSN